PLYRDRMGAIVKVLKDPRTGKDLAIKMVADGKVRMDPDGKGEVEITADLVEVERTWMFQGRSVNYITVGNTVVVLEDL
ncbi:MAG: hypothetical protein KAH57_02535, partial [Thermoplasmata archaeon]|nr:hypothetical protein [Thermoplasmata archaeon]